MVIKKINKSEEFPFDVELTSDGRLTMGCTTTPIDRWESGLEAVLYHNKLGDEVRIPAKKMINEMKVFYENYKLNNHDRR